MAGTTRIPHILCVNPWIHDFAAYDVWANPMGLLILAAILRDHGMGVSYINCLNRFHPKARPSDPSARHGRGPYIKTPLDMPDGLSDISRRFSRYGIPPQWLDGDLKAHDKPDLILVTSVMTYWASGVKETIARLKSRWPDVPVVLGGIYATLCEDHARRTSGADHIVAGPCEDKILDLVASLTGYTVASHYDLSGLDTLPYPAYDLQEVIPHVAVRTSRGCPFRCTYCASGYLSPTFSRRKPGEVFDELRYWYEEFGVRDVAFYDDALLVSPETHAAVLFQKVIDSGLPLRFHTPNALHVREISPDLARLMFQAGFKTLRLGVESTDFDNRRDMDVKIKESDYVRAVTALLTAGFKPEQVGAYLLIGLPGQRFEDVDFSVKEVLKSGITPVLTHYTPIPHTSLWEAARTASRYDLSADPVFTNNSIFPCRQETFSWNEITQLKALITEKRKK